MTHPLTSNPDRPTSLYRFYDAGDVLLYVGVTYDLVVRWNAHSHTKHDWRRVVRATIEHFGNRQEAEDAEAHAIRTERPLWNIKHRPWDRPADDVAAAAKVEAAVASGEWVSTDDIMTLFGVPYAMVSGWLDRGPKLTKVPLRHRLGGGGVIEVCPESIAKLLIETRKVRSGDHPDGIPDQKWSESEVKLIAMVGDK